MGWPPDCNCFCNVGCRGCILPATIKASFAGGSSPWDGMTIDFVRDGDTTAHYFQQPTCTEEPSGIVFGYQLNLFCNALNTQPWNLFVSMGNSSQIPPYSYSIICGVQNTGAWTCSPLNIVFDLSCFYCTIPGHFTTSTVTFTEV